ncbi:uncharacterized protein with PCYCGC motif [Paenibacillus cellulosilyticus]|uniref:Uncharacterized protein with PCYCGC motif n=1 Tax=Paenibacillus cellulosilyticus TaxID=375489 RepID=A0A2V2YMX1_9BACL|nr:PCYCGC motif-containing (lipo)protein [Paenibacillus cellulosilyticus]PWV95188.1 uncharacterized protein with PCYCGC motif [Paenibacillus cellulosilyticus]QKS46058.1 hypothetical protein HUB94_17670 [Paenibacillus cellulosilyticus]
MNLYRNPSKYTMTWLMTGVVSISLLSGCGSSASKDAAGASIATPEVSQASDAHANHVHTETTQLANGDIQETTASLDVLPSFLDGLPEKIVLAYQAAAITRDTLAWIPCYCGCGGSAGHESNLNCFIAEVHEDGSVVWDSHGTGCDVCVDTVLQTVQMKQEGKTVKEIRAAIDDAYRVGYAKPTATPMPT